MYHIIISNSAEKDLNKLPVSVLRKVGAAIDDLAAEPRPKGCKKLKGTKENL